VALAQPDSPSCCSKHLAFDAAKGFFMAASPWLFGFAKNGTR
jgi:hypothetical protein